MVYIPILDREPTGVRSPIDGIESTSGAARKPPAAAKLAAGTKGPPAPFSAANRVAFQSPPGIFHPMSY